MSILSQLCSMTREVSREEIADLLKEIPLPVKRDDLEVVLQNNLRPGASFLTIVSRTVPDMRVKDANGTPNPFRTGCGKSEVWHLFKVSTVNCMVCADYAKRVNKVRESLGLPADFKAEAMTWGMHRNVQYDDKEKHTCLVDHWYVDCPNDSCKHKYPKDNYDVRVCPLCGTARRSNVFVYVFPLHSLGYYYQMDDGTYVDPSLVNPFLKPFTVGKQGLDAEHEVRVRKYALDSLLRLSANGLLYEVANAQQQAAA